MEFDPATGTHDGVATDAAHSPAYGSLHVVSASPQRGRIVGWFPPSELAKMHGVPDNAERREAEPTHDAIESRSDCREILAKSGPTRDVAIVTVFSDEFQLLARWLEHHGQQVGVSNLYVIDTSVGTFDAACFGRANRVRLPGPATDEGRCCAFVSDFAAALLNWFDAVMIAEIDTLLVADPGRYSSLIDFCRRCDSDVVTSFGLELVGPIAVDQSVSDEQSIIEPPLYGLATARSAKPSFTRTPIRWSKGLHTWNGPPAFNGLFSFKLPAEAGSTGDPEILARASLPIDNEVTLDATCAATNRFIRRLILSHHGRDHNPVKIELTLQEKRLWRIPQRFSIAIQKVRK